MVSGVGGGRGADMAAMWQELLRKADKNADGKISKDELKAAMPQGNTGPSVDNLFSKIDTNADGFIDRSEDAAILRTGHRKNRQGSSDPLQVFQKADKDSDGKISKADFKSALPAGTKSATANQVFDSMDANQDGVVDASEYMAALQKAGLTTQLFPPEGFSTLA